MSKETQTSFLNPEKPNFYMDDIFNIADKVSDENGIILPDITEADLAIPMTIGSEVVGLGFLFIKGDEAVLMRMIDPDHQGKGLSYKLMDEIIRIAQKKGVSKLVSVVKDTLSSRKALESSGFEIDWEEEGKIRYVKQLN
ncbi:MAG: GNAT family N-acetyltransferase [Candidatus Pacebacteria bacterium]|nr:GNAT family N-acetyltransferase [Candidatus Paceibacterota bacterium]